MMDKQQALNSFWNSFDIPAYDENTVPDNAQFPYFTYETVIGSIDEPIETGGHLWDRSRDWDFLDSKANEVGDKILEMKPIKCDEGYLYITKSTPFARRISDDTDANVKGIAFNIRIEFFTN